MVDMAIVTNPEPGRHLSLSPLLGEPFALVSHPSLGIEAAVSVRQLAQIPLLVTSLHRRLVERQLMPLGGQLLVRAEIDSVDSIRELVLRGPWATVMPISVFKDVEAPRKVQVSEVSGVQLNRLLVLAMRVENWGASPLFALKEIIEAECARLVQRGIFGFSAGGAVSGQSTGAGERLRPPSVRPAAALRASKPRSDR